MTNMNRRHQWQKVLDSEVQRWLAMPYEQLQFALRHQQVYEIEFEAVDDGSLRLRAALRNQQV